MRAMVAVAVVAMMAVGGGCGGGEEPEAPVADAGSEYVPQPDIYIVEASRTGSTVSIDVGNGGDAPGWYRLAFRCTEPVPSSQKHEYSTLPAEIAPTARHTIRNFKPFGSTACIVFAADLCVSNPGGPNPWKCEPVAF